MGDKELSSFQSRHLNKSNVKHTVGGVVGNMNRVSQTRENVKKNYQLKKEDESTTRKIDKHQPINTCNEIANISLCLHNEHGVLEDSHVYQGFSGHQHPHIPTSSVVSIHLNVDNKPGSKKGQKPCKCCHDCDGFDVTELSSSGLDTSPTTRNGPQANPNIKHFTTFSPNLNSKPHSTPKKYISYSPHGEPQKNVSYSPHGIPEKTSKIDRGNVTGKHGTSDSSTDSTSVYQKSVLQKQEETSSPISNISAKSRSKKNKNGSTETKPISKSKLGTSTALHLNSFEDKEQFQLKRGKHASSDSSSNKERSLPERKGKLKKLSKKKQKGLAKRSKSSSKSSSAASSVSVSDPNGSMESESSTSRRRKSPVRRRRKLKRDTGYTSSEDEKKKSGGKSVQKILEDHKRRLVELEKKIDDGVMKKICHEFSNIKKQINCLCNRCMDTDNCSPCCAPTSHTTDQPQRTTAPLPSQRDFPQKVHHGDFCCMCKSNMCQNYSDKLPEVEISQTFITKQYQPTRLPDKLSSNLEITCRPNSHKESEWKGCVEFYECSLRLGECSKMTTRVPYMTSCSEERSNNRTSNRNDSTYSLMKCRASCRLTRNTYEIADKLKVSTVQPISGGQQYRAVCSKNKVKRAFDQFLTSQKQVIPHLKTCKRSIQTPCPPRQPAHVPNRAILSDIDQHNEPCSDKRNIPKFGEYRTSIVGSTTGNTTLLNISSLAELSKRQ